jgi:hypothetical protein
MAINVNPGAPLRHVARITSSGNFVAPANASLAFVSIHGATGGGGGGGGSRYGQNGGNSTSIIASAFIEIIPGSTNPVAIGAGGAAGGASPGGGRYNYGANGSSGTNGGTTTFDGATLTVTGATGGVGGSAAPSSFQVGQSQATSFADSTATGITSLSTVNPGGGVLIKTKTIATQATGANYSAGGAAGRYGAAPGAAGIAGFINVYI